MARFWEVLTLIGFLLMSGELVIQDKAKLNNRWHGIIEALTKRFPFNRVGGSWRRSARNDSLTTVFIASWFIWVPLVFGYFLNSALQDIRWENATVINLVLIIGAFVILPNVLFAFFALQGIAILVFHFSERALNTGNATYFGLQLGAYITVVAQIKKVIFP